jgi:hypothetical protein
MGPLGVAFDDRQMVVMMLPQSQLRGQVNVGDRLLHINGEPAGKFTGQDVARYLTELSKSGRRLQFLRIAAPEDNSRRRWGNAPLSGSPAVGRLTTGEHGFATFVAEEPTAERGGSIVSVAAGVDDHQQQQSIGSSLWRALSVPCFFKGSPEGATTKPSPRVRARAEGQRNQRSRSSAATERRDANPQILGVPTASPPRAAPHHASLTLPARNGAQYVLAVSPNASPVATPATPVMPPVVSPRTPPAVPSAIPRAVAQVAMTSPTSCRVPSATPRGAMPLATPRAARAAAPVLAPAATPGQSGGSLLRVTSLPANGFRTVASPRGVAPVEARFMTPRQQPCENRGNTIRLAPSTQRPRDSAEESRFVAVSRGRPQEPDSFHQFDDTLRWEGRGIGHESRGGAIGPTSGLRTVASRPLSQERIRRSPARVALTPCGNGVLEARAPALSNGARPTPRCGSPVKKFGRVWTPRRDTEDSLLSNRRGMNGWDSALFTPVTRRPCAFKSPDGRPTEPVAAHEHGAVRKAASTASLPLRRAL